MAQTLQQLEAELYQVQQAIERERAIVNCKAAAAHFHSLATVNRSQYLTFKPQAEKMDRYVKILSDESLSFNDAKAIAGI